MTHQLTITFDIADAVRGSELLGFHGITEGIGWNSIHVIRFNHDHMDCDVDEATEQVTDMLTEERVEFTMELIELS